ncbi:MAG: TIGR03619 family F420-dependent LLM class oxidoreductase [Pseudomonadota bacterium]
MLRRITAMQMPEIGASFETMHVEIAVMLTNGERITARCNRPAGAWGEVIAPEIHLTKVRDCLAFGLDRDKAERVIGLVDRFETLDNDAVRGLLALVGGTLMRYGFYLPVRGPLATYDGVAETAQLGERLGFYAATCADHIVIPTTVDSRYPYAASGVHPSAGDALEQLSLLAFVAGKTEKLRLVTSVMVMPHRNPVLSAKTIATIDVLSRGRITLGVGVGWMREEFAALGAADFDRRGAVTDEYIAIWKKLWTTSPVAHDGRFYSFGPVRCEPPPQQRPHPPIWIGGHTDAALRRAARLGDGWHPIGADPEPLVPPALTERLATLKRLTEEGRARFRRAHDLVRRPPAVDRPGAAAGRPQAVRRLGGADRRRRRDLPQARRLRAHLRLPQP